MNGVLESMETAMLLLGACSAVVLPAVDKMISAMYAVRTPWLD